MNTKLSGHDLNFDLSNIYDPYLTFAYNLWKQLWTTWATPWVWYWTLKQISRNMCSLNIHLRLCMYYVIGYLYPLTLSAAEILMWSKLNSGGRNRLNDKLSRASTMKPSILYVHQFCFQVFFLLAISPFHPLAVTIQSTIFNCLSGSVFVVRIWVCGAVTESVWIYP